MSLHRYSTPIELTTFHNNNDSCDRFRTNKKLKRSPSNSSIGRGNNFSPSTGSEANQWSCPHCGKLFYQNSNFKNHIRTHSDERPHVCDLCSIGFKERYHLKKHVLYKHTDDLKETCRKCGKRFKDSTAVRAHERIHSELRPYACGLCGKNFKTSECLWHHENRSKTCGKAILKQQQQQALLQGTSVPFKRPRRSRIVNNNINNNINNLNNTCNNNNVESFKTTFVGTRNENQKVYQLKTAPMNKGEKLLAANNISNNAINKDIYLINNKKFEKNNLNSLNSLNNSNDNLSKGEEGMFEQMMQEIDDSIFEDVNKELIFPNDEFLLTSQIPLFSSDSINVDNNNNIYSFSVNSLSTTNSISTECFNKTIGETTDNFNENNTNNNENEENLEERPHKCGECGQGFKLKVHLKKHILYRHSSEYPCECSICGKRFKDSSAVRLHERIHSTERPFSCPCGKSFKTKENLWGHKNRGPCDLRYAGTNNLKDTSSANIIKESSEEIYTEEKIETNTEGNEEVSGRKISIKLAPVSIQNDKTHPSVEQITFPKNNILKIKSIYNGSNNSDINKNHTDKTIVNGAPKAINLINNKNNKPTNKQFILNTSALKTLKINKNNNLGQLGNLVIPPNSQASQPAIPTAVVAPILRSIQNAVCSRNNDEQNINNIESQSPNDCGSLQKSKDETGQINSASTDNIGSKHGFSLENKNEVAGANTGNDDQKVNKTNEPMIFKINDNYAIILPTSLFFGNTNINKVDTNISNIKSTIENSNNNTNNSNTNLNIKNTKIQSVNNSVKSTKNDTEEKQNDNEEISKHELKVVGEVYSNFNNDAYNNFNENKETSEQKNGLISSKSTEEKNKKVTNLKIGSKNNDNGSHKEDEKLFETSESVKSFYNGFSLLSSTASLPTSHSSNNLELHQATFSEDEAFNTFLEQLSKEEPGLVMDRDSFTIGGDVVVEGGDFIANAEDLVVEGPWLMNESFLSDLSLPDRFI